MNVVMISGALLSGMMLGWMVMRFQARRFSSLGAAGGAWGEAHMGYLFGGRARTSDVWWTQLVNGGHLERSGTRNRGGVEGWRRTDVVPVDPRLRSAWDALPARSCTSWWHAHTRHWVDHHRTVQSELISGGLLPSASQLVGRQLQSVGWVVVLVGAGLVCWALGAPWVGVALVAAAVFSLPSLGRPLDAFNTQSGHQQMLAWRAQHAASARAPQASTIGYAVAVAGLGALAGTPYVVHAREGTSATSSSGGDGGFTLAMADDSFSSPGASSVSSSDYATSGGFGGESASTSGDSGSSGCGGGGCGGGGCGG